MIKRLLLLSVVVVANCPSATMADLFITPAGSELDGLPVDASANVEITANGVITVKLTNNVVNPTSFIQVVTGFGFSLNNASGAGGSIASRAATEISIDSSGIISSASGGADWNYNSPGLFSFNDIEITSMGNQAAGPGLIGMPDGSNVYSNANGSIAGNPAHDLFLQNMAIFVLNVPDVVKDEKMIVGTPRFIFGSNGTSVAVPEPSAFLYAGFVAAVVGCGYRLKRRRR